MEEKNQELENNEKDEASIFTMELAQQVQKPKYDIGEILTFVVDSGSEIHVIPRRWVKK